jgi:hypothetical protein
VVLVASAANAVSVAPLEVGRMVERAQRDLTCSRLLKITCTLRYPLAYLGVWHKYTFKYCCSYSPMFLLIPHRAVAQFRMVLLPSSAPASPSFGSWVWNVQLKANLFVADASTPSERLRLPYAVYSCERHCHGSIPPILLRCPMYSRNIVALVSIGVWLGDQQISLLYVLRMT